MQRLEDVVQAIINYGYAHSFLNGAVMIDDRDAMWRGVPKRAISGLIVGLVPFIFSCTSSATTTQNGRMVGCSYLDFAAIAGGGIAAIAGLSILTMRPVPLLHRVGYLVLLGTLGAVQLARGLGYIDSPCS